MQTTFEERKRLIEAFHQSGQTQKAFCQAQGISRSSLSYWLKRDKELNAPQGFIPVKTGKEPELKPEIIYPNGVKIVVSGDDLALISRLVKLY